jgi:hypothetical protein
MAPPPARLLLRAHLARRRAALLVAAALTGPGALTASGAVGALGLAAAGACYGRGRNAPTPQEATTLRVRNQSFLDHNIYVLNGGARTRLGTVTGNGTAVLRIPASFVQPGALLRFVADPIGSSVTPVSDQIAVTPGDEVQLIIPPR